MNLSRQYTEKDLKYFQGKRLEMVDYVPQQAKVILDVGCGAGNFGKSLKQLRSAEVWGVEIDERAAQEASNKLDKVVNAPFDGNLSLPNHTFDCVSFIDVLEHFIDPEDALEYTKKLLAPQGVVVACIPNIRYFDFLWDLLVNKKWEYTDKGILDRTHLRFFTYSSILSMFNRLNYKVELIQGIHPTGVRKFYWLNRLTLGHLEDAMYLHFVIVASVN